MSKEQKAPTSAEKILANNLGKTSNLSLEENIKNFKRAFPDTFRSAVDAMEQYAAQTCPDKQSELDNVWSELKGMQSKYKKVVAEKQAEIDLMNRDFRPFAEYVELRLKYEELKAKADKMKEILKRLDPMLITDYLQDVIDEAIQEYESIDKVNK